MLRIGFLFSIIFIALDTEIKGGKSRNQSLRYIQFVSYLFVFILSWRLIFALELSVLNSVRLLRSTYLLYTNIVVL